MSKKATKAVDELQQRDGGASLTVKELKTMLDDGLLDLRMRAMSTVPVKAIAQITQATNIDLSTNLLQILPNDFATSLVRITKLDLSRNAIVHLPDNFGELKNLISLDLYKNQIEDLPLSFCKLNQLKWLDLKDNPLNPELAKEAGDCLDEKQCKKAALQVVRYMGKLEQDHERIRQQQLQQREAQRRATEESEMAAKKAKNATKKNEKRQVSSKLDEEAIHASGRQSQTNGNSPKKSDKPVKSSEKEGLRGGSKRTRGYCCRFLMLLPLLITALSIYSLYNNCAAETKWIPQSGLLCRDLRTVMTTRTLPKTLLDNFFVASQGLSKMISRKVSDTITHIQHSDMSMLANDVSVSIRDGFVAVADKIRISSTEAMKHTSIWWTNSARPFLNDVFKIVSVWVLWFVEQSKLMARILVEIAIDIVDFMMEKSVDTYRWLSVQLSDLPSTSVYYWEKVKHLWNNVK